MNEKSKTIPAIQLKTSAPTILGLILAEHRQAREVSQHDLGEATGRSQGHISKIEKGRVNASEETLTKAATYLGTTFEDLRTATGKCAAKLRAKGIVVLEETPPRPDEETGVYLSGKELAKVLDLSR